MIFQPVSGGSSEGLNSSIYLIPGTDSRTVRFPGKVAFFSTHDGELSGFVEASSIRKVGNRSQYVKLSADGKTISLETYDSSGPVYICVLG